MGAKVANNVSSSIEFGDFCWLSFFLWFGVEGKSCSNFLASTVVGPNNGPLVGPDSPYCGLGRLPLPVHPYIKDRLRIAQQAVLPFGPTLGFVYLVRGN